MQDGARLRVLNTILQEQALKRYVCANLCYDGLIIIYLKL